MDLKLYHKWMCPYSAKVREFIEKNNLRNMVEYVDRDENKENAQRLKDISGSTQVPCLVIDGKPMQESDDIIHWLQDHLINQNDARA